MAYNSLSAKWPKIANNAETVSAENSPKFRPKLLAVNPFGRTLTVTALSQKETQQTSDNEGGTTEGLDDDGEKEGQLRGIIGPN